MLTDTESREIVQKIDGKRIVIRASELDDVLFRTDTDSQDFIQINFSSGLKILMTESLIGFKPATLSGLDMSKLPKVVTTPDILSVFEAIQEALYFSEKNPQDELQMLKKVFDAVVTGGEAIGFDLAYERSWIGRIPTNTLKASA